MAAGEGEDGGDKRVLTGQVGVAKEELEATRRSLNEVMS